MPSNRTSHHLWSSQTDQSISPRLGLALMRRYNTTAKSSNRGFTLIESLVAMVVITITIISIIPPIFWATATRVQNRRIEQAIQLAQSEIDRVRNGIERQDFTLADLPPQAGAQVRPNAPAPTSIDNDRVRSVVPSCNRGDGRPPNQSNFVVAIDTDPGDNCRPEFYVQVFRGQGISATPGGLPDGIVMGVRVYSLAAAPGGVLSSGLDTRPGKLSGTSGVGTQRSRPLAVQFSAIVRSNAGDGISLYRQLCTPVGDGCFDPNDLRRGT
jgi:prepilin-type N-terminal cleavage/methylation domain-containing protein